MYLYCIVIDYIKGDSSFFFSLPVEKDQKFTGSKDAVTKFLLKCMLYIHVIHMKSLNIYALPYHLTSLLYLLYIYIYIIYTLVYSAISEG